MSEQSFHPASPVISEASQLQSDAAQWLHYAEDAFARDDLATAAASWQTVLDSYDEVFTGEAQRKRDVEYNLTLCYIFMSDSIDQRAFDLIRLFTEDEFADGVGDPGLEADLRQIHKMLTGAVEGADEE